MRACARVEECERAREFARGSTNGGVIEKEREREMERATSEGSLGLAQLEEDGESHRGR